MMYSRMVGTRRATSEAKRANCVRAVAVNGVVLLPTGMAGRAASVGMDPEGVNPKPLLVRIPRLGERIAGFQPIFDTSQGRVAKALAAGGREARHLPHRPRLLRRPGSPPGPLSFSGAKAA